MREIKFRAWVKAVRGHGTKPFLQCFELTDITRDDFGNHGIQTERYEWLADLDDCELMQYTGLKDKNGKEIYEGDIFRQKGMEGELSTGTIIYYDDLSYRCREGDSIFHKVKFTGEVIGNIYENPELLEGSPT